MRLPAGARLCIVLLLVLGMAGCEVAHPDWAYFDAERHPVGAVPAQTGFYTGAYVVAPPLIVLAFLAIPFTGNVPQQAPSWQGVRRVSYGVGVGLGVILGAPFHLVALPFGSRGGDDEPASLGEPAPGGDARYDETPPAVPRDYPWPPKPSR